MIVNSQKSGVVLAILMLISALVSGLAIAQTMEQENQATVLFQGLKHAVFVQPYENLPTYSVTRELFGGTGKNADNRLLNAARRTLTDQRDLIDFPSGQKLLNANGICFVGQWRIHQDSNFTGLYAPAVTSPVIVRASVALGGTRRKDKRAFGMAIKLLPKDLANLPSLNIFVLNSMGGTITKQVLDLSMDNQPPLGRIPKWSDIGTALRLRRDLEKADKEQGAAKPLVAFRPVDHLAEYRVAGPVRSPRWLRLSAITTERLDRDDFREELRVESYSDNQLVYQIEVAEGTSHTKKSKAVWQSLGELTLTESVTSQACDSQLHFKHPNLPNKIQK